VSDFSDVKRPRGEGVTSTTPRKAAGPYFAPRHPTPSRKESTMPVDTAATSELPKLNLPPDLLTEVKRGGKSKVNYHLESMKPSLFDRFVEKLLGKK